MLRSRQNLEIGEWTTITVSRNVEKQESRLSVNKETPIRAIENGNMHTLELKTHLYVGGYDSHKVKISKNVDVETNFKGCIKMVTYSIHDIITLSDYDNIFVVVDFFLSYRVRVDFSSKYPD